MIERKGDRERGRKPTMKLIVYCIRHHIRILTTLNLLTIHQSLFELIAIVSQAEAANQPD